MEIDFKSTFLNYDFDSILLNNNNPLLNSYDIYIQYKQKYIISTRKNYDLYQKLIKEYLNLKKTQYNNPSPNVVVYTYISEDKLNELSFKIKNLLKTQKRALDNFLHYINHLNDNVNHYITNETDSSSKSTIRRTKNIFTRLLDGGTKAKLKRRTPTT
jgi:hypothetical protein